MKHFTIATFLLSILLLVGCTHNIDSTSNGTITEGLVILKAEGKLKVTAPASTETYNVYFHIPISFGDQVPILIKVDCPEIIEYRFLPLDPPNILIAARMRRADYTYLNWYAWVLIKESECGHEDFPEIVPIPTPEQLPEETKKWLQATSCVQVDAPIVQETAGSIRGDTTTLKELTSDIALYCRNNILSAFAHTPYSFSAVYALKWGNSCTGHAHAGVALLRANGIPARSLLNISTLSNDAMDMHWIADYYAPDYGWIKMETAMGQNFYSSQNIVVTMVAYPGNECPLFYPDGIEGFWFSSDPALGIINPDWGRAHKVFRLHHISGSVEKMRQAFSLAKSVFDYHSQYWGIWASFEEKEIMEAALAYQEEGFASLQENDLENYIAIMNEALKLYEQIEVPEVKTLFFDDFENGNSGWTHGGVGDEWELGKPAYASLYPIHAFSGNKCWGTDLDDTYENNTDCWLLSPSIDLEHLSSACFSCRIWNWVQDHSQGFVDDPLWLEITTDGKNFYPFCTYMGGVVDDPEIPDTGGWNKLTLDLAGYVGQKVRIRFRFRSDENIVQPGSHIDNVHVYGRQMTN
jgi:hypothetical protein